MELRSVLLGVNLKIAWTAVSGEVRRSRRMRNPYVDGSTHFSRIEMKLQGTKLKEIEINQAKKAYLVHVHKNSNCVSPSYRTTL